MKIGLIYATKTGHSRKIAKAIAQELQIEAMSIRTKPQLDSIDLLYIVGGIYAGKSAPEFVEFVKGIDSKQAKQAVLITSSCGTTASQTEIREVLTNNGIPVVEEEFKCRGSFLFFGMGHPNADDIKNAVAFAKEVSKQG